MKKDRARRRYFEALESRDLLAVTALSTAFQPGVSITANDSSEVQGQSQSADGRYVVFMSLASNLVPGDTNASYDAFRKDTWTGAIELVSKSPAGVQASNGSFYPSISGDGRIVTFLSRFPELTNGNTKLQLFAKNMETGWLECLTIVNSAAGNDNSYPATLSHDGRFVAFTSFSNNLVAGDTNGTLDAFVRDRQTGTMTLVSRSALGVQGNGGTNVATISADGTQILMTSAASNLVMGDSNNASDIFLKNLSNGSITRLTQPGQNPNTARYSDPSISANFRYLTYTYADYGETKSYLKDLQTNTITTLYPVTSSRDAPLAVSNDGRYLLFTAWTALLNGFWVDGVFVKDLQTGRELQLNVDPAGGPGNGGVYGAALSADGNYVAFHGSDSNLVGGDLNSRYDVFATQNPFVVRTLTAAPVDDIVVLEDAPNIEIDLWSIFTHNLVSDQNLTYTILPRLYQNPSQWTNYDSYFSALNFDPLTGKLSVDLAPNVNGFPKLTVRATDDVGIYAEIVIDVDIIPVLDTPSVTNATTFINVPTTEGLVVTPFPGEAGDVTHYKITNIQNGRLFYPHYYGPELGLLEYIEIFNGDYIDAYTYPFNSLKLQFLPNDNSTATGSFQIQSAKGTAVTDEMSPPATATINIIPQYTITSININNESARQRSIVKNLTIPFSGLVTVQPGAFVLTQQPSGAAVNVTVTTSVVEGKTTATLTFSGSLTENGSLKDGNYQLLINGDKLLDQNGGYVDVDKDGIAGGTYIFGAGGLNAARDKFFRLFGDSDGDRDVDNSDLLRFRVSQNRVSIDPLYAWYFDYDQDGDVDNSDLLRFRLRSGIVLPS